MSHDAALPPWKLGSGEEVLPRLNYGFDPELFVLLPGMLSAIRSEDRTEFWVTHDFGRNIGENPVVPVPQDSEEVFYAKRAGKPFFSRIVREAVPEKTSRATVVLKKMFENPEAYLILTAYLGAKREPEVGDPRQNSESPNFWSTHAFVLGAKRVSLTETYRTKCPWKIPNHTLV